MHVVHDERAAAFVALGLGLGGVPAVLVSTSGTAAVNFHPAVVEADLSDVPMIVVTADRPPELRDVGAPADDRPDPPLRARGAVVPRSGGGRPGARADVAVARPPGGSRPRRLGRCTSTCRSATRSSAGPARCRRRCGSANGDDTAPAPRAVSADVVVELDQVRGVILAGGRSGVDPDDVAALAAATQWPVLADPTSGVRGLDGAVAPFDALLRHREFAADHSPHVVVRIGRPGGLEGARRVGPGLGGDARAVRRAGPDRSGSSGGRPARYRRRGDAGGQTARGDRHAVVGPLASRGRAGGGRDRRAARRASGTDRTGRGAHRRPVPSAGGRTGRRLLDAGARPRVVRRPDGAGSGQPGRQRHRRGRLDGARRRPRRRADGRARR